MPFSQIIESGQTTLAATDELRPAATAAADTQPLSLRRSIELAFEHNPELAAARLEVDANAGAREQASAYRNPELSYLQEDTRGATRTMTLQLDQPIELGGKRMARLSAAQRGYDVAVADLAARRVAVRAAVTAGYFDAVAARERTRVTDEALELTRRAVRAAALRVSAGKVSPLEETRARVAEAGVQVQASRARSELRESNARLAALIGQERLPIEPLEGDLGELPSVPALDEMRIQIENAPALRRGQLEIERRIAVTQVERARRIPDLTVSFGVKRDEGADRNQAIVGVSVPLPLFDSNRGNLLEALTREDKAREDLRAARLQLTAEALQARERLESAREEAESLTGQVLPSARSAYEAAVKGFERGKFGFLDALDAQRTLLDARLQLVRAMAEAHRAGAELDRILGHAEAASGGLAPPAVEYWRKS